MATLVVSVCGVRSGELSDISGGTFQGKEIAFSDVADEIAMFATNGGQHSDDADFYVYEPQHGLDLPKVGVWLPPVLREVHELVREIDFHFASDSFIGNEDEWIISARARLTKLLAVEPVLPQVDDDI